MSPPPEGRQRSLQLLLRACLPAMRLHEPCRHPEPRALFLGLAFPQWVPLPACLPLYDNALLSMGTGLCVGHSTCASDCQCTRGRATRSLSLQCVVTQREIASATLRCQVVRMAKARPVALA